MGGTMARKLFARYARRDLRKIPRDSRIALTRMSRTHKLYRLASAALPVSAPLITSALFPHPIQPFPFTSCS